MAEVNRFALLTREEEFELALRFQEEGDLLAANQLITANLRFVVKVANQYRHYGINLLDLIQEGNIGLMKAVEKFDAHRGYRLISYAVWWIKAYIQAYIVRSWSLVKIGTTQAQRKLFYKLSEAKRRLGIDGESPTAAEIAEDLNVPEKAVVEMEMRMASRDFGLDQQVGDEPGTTFLDMVTDESDTQEEVYADYEHRAWIAQITATALTGLSEKEQYVVRFRLMTLDPMTLQAIGDHFGISRERVRQIEGNAKRKLKRVLGEERRKEREAVLPPPEVIPTVLVAA